jgi:hypothetical protein
MKIEFEGAIKNWEYDVFESLESTVNRKGGTKHEIY